MSPKKHDIVIIGSGPGGYTAAIRAAQLGMNTAIVEKEKVLGGICLNWGCIPTKALLDQSHLYSQAKNSAISGVTFGNVSFDFGAIMAEARAKSEKLASGVKYLMSKNNITVYEGNGYLHSGVELDVQMLSGKKTSILSKNIILATGAKLRDLPSIKRDGKNIWNAKDAIIAQKLPKSLCVIGSGAIGIEFATFFSDLGSKVTIIEAQDKILPTEDEDISTILLNSLKRKGIDIHTSAIVNLCEYSGNPLKVSFTKNGESIVQNFENVLLAVGVEGNSGNLGLQNTKVSIGKSKFIEVDANYKTAEPNLFAIGDLIGAPCLAHKASHEGVICVEKIAGKKDVHNLDYSSIPGCIFSHPQIASAGLTEKQAKAKGINIKVGKFNAAANGRSVILGCTEGLVKVISEAQTGELLGIHMIGHDVSEMLPIFSVGKMAEVTVETIKNTIFPHPTVSEMIHEAFLNVDGETINS